MGGKQKRKGRGTTTNTTNTTGETNTNVEDEHMTDTVGGDTTNESVDTKEMVEAPIIPTIIDSTDERPTKLQKLDGSNIEESKESEMAQGNQPPMTNVTVTHGEVEATIPQTNQSNEILLSNQIDQSIVAPTETNTIEPVQVDSSGDTIMSAPAQMENMNQSQSNQPTESESKQVNLTDSSNAKSQENTQQFILVPPTRKGAQHTDETSGTTADVGGGEQTRQPTPKQGEPEGKSNPISSNDENRAQHILLSPPSSSRSRKSSHEIESGKADTRSGEPVGRGGSLAPPNPPLRPPPTSTGSSTHRQSRNRQIIQRSPTSRLPPIVHQQPAPFLEDELVLELLATPLLREYVDPVSGQVDPEFQSILEEFEAEGNYFSFNCNQPQTIRDGVTMIEAMTQEIHQSSEEYKSQVMQEMADISLQLGDTEVKAADEFTQRLTLRVDEYLQQEENIQADNMKTQEAQIKLQKFNVTM